MCRAPFQSLNKSVPSKGAAHTRWRQQPWVPWVVLGFVLGSQYGSAHAEPFVWVPSPSQSPNQIGQDLELSLRARKLLLEDKVLAGQVVGVSVRNRTATLWGSVSSPSSAQHAEACLRSLPGLASVQNRLTIEDHDRMAQRSPLALGSQHQPPAAEHVHGALVHRAGESVPTQDPLFVWRPVRPKGKEPAPEPAAPPPVPTKPAVDSLPGFPSRDSTQIPSPSAVSALLIPRLKAEGAAPLMPALTLPADSPRAVSTPSSTVPQGPSGLSQVIEALRLEDDRFRGVRVEVRSETVTLHGTVACWEHLFELAGSIARVPGVRQVRFGYVRAESDR